MLVDCADAADAATTAADNGNATTTDTAALQYDRIKNCIPNIDNSIFSSDEYLHAIGADHEESLQEKKKSRYGNMGISSLSKSTPVAPVMPDCESMSPKRKAKAMKEYMLDKEAYQRDRKAETDSALKERRKGACGRAIQWAQIEYTGDNIVSRLVTT